MRARPILAVLATATALGAGCGGDGGGATTSTGPVETADRAKLPRSWSRHTNFDAGVSLGLPPLWRAADRGIRTVVHSPDQLLAISVTTDRTDEAIEFDLAEFATRVGDALPGFEGSSGLAPKPFAHRYSAVSKTVARGEVDGPAESLLLVILAREGLVKVTALTAWNAEKAPARDVRDARRILRTIRTRPIGT